MQSAHISLISVQWDFRSLWGILPILTKAYLVGLLGIATFASITSARMHWSLRQTNRDHDREGPLTHARLASYIHSLRQLMVLALLAFGAALASSVFGSLRAVRFSYMSLSEYRLEEALEVPTAVAFFSFSIFVYLHLLQWCADARLQRRLRQG